MGVKTVLKKSRVLRALHRKYVVARDNRRKNKEQKRFLARAPRIMAEVQETLTESGLLFYFDMGTLLGIYRDHRFIKRDMDLDLAVYPQGEADVAALRERFAAKGFCLTFIYEGEDIGPIQDTYYKDDVRVDLCFYTRDGERDSCYLMYDETDHVGKLVRLDCSAVRAVQSVRFCDVDISIPENTELYLSERYGADWRTPDGKYKYWEGPSTTKIDNVGHSANA